VKPHHPLPRKKPVAGPSLLERMNPNAAGIDCGAETHYVAVPPDRDATPVRVHDIHERLAFRHGATSYSPEPVPSVTP